MVKTEISTENKNVKGNECKNQIENGKAGIVMEMKNVEEIATNVYAEDEFDEVNDFEGYEGDYRIMDYIGVQEYLADDILGEITTLDKAEEMFKYWLEDSNELSWEELRELYKGDINRIARSIKYNFIDSYLDGAYAMEYYIEGDRMEHLLRTGMIIKEENEDYSNKDLRVFWTSWLDEEWSGTPERKKELQDLFTDIKENYRRVALWNLFQDRVTDEKSAKAKKEHRCPICGEKIFLPAISRVDDDTEICSECGQLEAAVVFGF